MTEMKICADTRQNLDRGLIPSLWCLWGIRKVLREVSSKTNEKEKKEKNSNASSPFSAQSLNFSSGEFCGRPFPPV